MGSPQFSPSPPHQYPQAIQLKLYQAFIFSIPILFSIILFLLFYLFYLKRRASSSTPVLPRTINDANIAATFDSGSKNELKNKMCTILFDEYMRVKDSLCCVCLGEFEVEEELLQVPSCKHVFHVDCIRYWLHNHSTCPLCRAAVVSDNHIDSKSHPPPPPRRPSFPSNLTPSSLPQQQPRLHNCTNPFEGSSSGTSSSGSGGNH